MKDLVFNNGVSIPRVGLGVWRAQEGDDTYNAVRYALDAGYRLIDTARVYGNEKSVGKAIRESGIDRSEIFLTTKLWNDDIRAHRTKEAFQESLDDLGLDYVDLYLIHWPAEGYEEAWLEMEDLYKEGKIRAIGLSNFHLHHLDSLMEKATVHPVIDQIESSPYFTNQELIDAIQAKGIIAESWSPFGGHRGNMLDDPLLAELSKKYNKNPGQLVVRWNVDRDVVVIPKSVHKERIISNFDVFDFELEPEDIQAISNLDCGRRMGSSPDNFSF